MGRSNPKGSGWIWPVLSAALLVFGLVAGGIMIVIASNHPSLQVDENYYDRAVHYDDYKAQLQANEDLGWSPSLEVRRLPVAGARNVQVAVKLLDRDGHPVKGASVAVSAFHLARSGDVFRQVLSETGPGVYSARMPLRRTGIWEFRLLAERDQDRFTAVLSREF